MNTQAPHPSETPASEPIPLSLIGELFIARRKELGISQEELGQRLGMLRAGIVRWEATKYTTVSLERLTKVAQALELEVSLVVKPASQQAKRLPSPLSMAQE